MQPTPQRGFIFLGKHMAPLRVVVVLAAASSALAFMPVPAVTRRPGLSLRPVLQASASATYELDGKSIRGPLTPVEDTVIIKVDKPKEMTGGGLFLPDQAVKIPTRGTVVAAGPGQHHWDTGAVMPMKVQAGDRAVYGANQGASVKYQGEDHLLMRDDEILMTYEGEEITLDTIRMVGDRVLVRIKKDPSGTQTSSSGVLVAPSATKTEREATGIVEKMGEGKRAANGVLMPLYATAGDHVKFKEFAAEYVTVVGLDSEEEEYVVIRNIDILAKW